MTQPESRPIRGLVLAGGGAKGAYQIGAYQALQEIGWMPDLITGTSVGCLNAALFVVGKVEEAAGLPAGCAARRRAGSGTPGRDD